MSTSHSPKRRVSLRAVVQQHTRAAYQDAILTAAERVFSRLGYFDAKMSDIARETGVSVGTLYNYFESKEAVVQSLAQRAHDGFLAAVEQAAQVRDPMDRLEAMATAVLRFFEERGDLFAAFTKVGMTNENECNGPAGALRVQSYMRFLTLLEEVMREASEQGSLRRDWSPRQLAAGLAGVLNSAIFLWLHDGRVGPLAERGKGVLDLFVKGARGA